MKNKTMREIVALLESFGYEIKYYVRTDGSILIRQIDNQKYPMGAKGNAVARVLAGERLSEKREAQLRKIKPPKIEIPNELKKELQKVQRKWRKQFATERYKKSERGRPTSKKIREALKRGGEEEAKKILGEWGRYASGIAYTKNVEALADYVLQYANSNPNLSTEDLIKLEDLADEIIRNSDNIREDWIYPAYEALYDLDKGISVDDVILRVRSILRL